MPRERTSAYKAPLEMSCRQSFRPRTRALTMRATSHNVIPEHVNSLPILIFDSQLKAVRDQTERRNPSL